MARGKRAAVAAETEPEQNEIQTPAEVTTNEGNDMTAATAIEQPEIDPNDALPIDIPESDTKEVMFKGELVRAVMTKPHIETAPAGSNREDNPGGPIFWARQDKDTYAYACDFTLRADQETPELSELAGMTLKFNRFPIAPGTTSQSIMVKLANSYGFPLSQIGRNLATLDQVAVLIAVKSSVSEDKRTGGTKIRHNINAILRDIEYEKAHGAGQ